MRYYGSNYLQNLTDSIQATRDNTEVANYATSIIHTTVANNRATLKRTCQNAAIQAFNHMGSIKSKLDTLQEAANTFYGEVDTTADEISALASSISEILSGANESLTNLTNLLNGAGRYSGVPITGENIGLACSPMINVNDARFNYYHQYYFNRFVTPDGRIDYAAMDEYVEVFNANGGIPQNIEEAAMLQAFEDATYLVLTYGDLSDEEYDEMFNEYMSRFLTQSTDFNSCSDCPIEEWGYDPETGDTVGVVWYNYTLNSSGQTFINDFSLRLSLAYGDPTSDTSANTYGEQNLNSIQFVDCMQSITRTGNVSIPYYFNADDMDSYLQYRQDHWINPDVQPDESVFLSDCNCVEMPFFGEFHIERTEGPNCVNTDENSNISIITYSNNYSSGNNNFCVFTQDDMGYIDKTVLTNTCVYSYDENLSYALSTSQWDSDGAIIEGTRREITYTNPIDHLLGGYNCLGGIFNLVKEDTTSLVFPGMPTANFLDNPGTATGQFVSSIGTVSGCPYIKVAGVALTYLGKEYDAYFQFLEDTEYNNYLDQYESTRASNRTSSNLYANTNAIGSYYVDNYDPSDSNQVATSITVLPQVYVRPNSCQQALCYACLNDDEQNEMLNYTSDSEQAIEYLGQTSLNSAGFDEYRSGLDDYFEDYCTNVYGSAGAVDISDLTPDEIIAVSNAYNRDWYHNGSAEEVYENGDLSPSDIPGFDPNKYR